MPRHVDEAYSEFGCIGMRADCVTHAPSRPSMSADLTTIQGEPRVPSHPSPRCEIVCTPPEVGKGTYGGWRRPQEPSQPVPSTSRRRGVQPRSQVALVLVRSIRLQLCFAGWRPASTRHARHRRVEKESRHGGSERDRAELPKEPFFHCHAIIDGGDHDDRDGSGKSASAGWAAHSMAWNQHATGRWMRRRECRRCS